MAKGYNLLNV